LEPDVQGHHARKFVNQVGHLHTRFSLTLGHLHSSRRHKYVLQA
jgi:hypothetical protein